MLPLSWLCLEPISFRVCLGNNDCKSACKGAWVLKRFAETTSLVSITVGVAVALFVSSTMAEVVERPWKDPAAPKEIRPTGFFNSLLPKKTQPHKPAAPVAGSINIIPEKRAAKVGKAKVRKKKPGQVEKVKTVEKNTDRKAEWWETVGNPAVFAFRDCSVKFAKNQTVVANTTTPANVITSAMKTSCKIEFTKMAGVLIGGLGEKRSNAMLTELARTTFLPPVEIALRELRVRQIAVVAQTTSKANLEAAKAGMFQCFSERTDRLTIAKNTQANTIADAVLAGCQVKSDAFFDLLFANSKASSQIKQQQKNVALNETYKIAIIRRVLATRKPSQVKTAIQQ